MSCPFVMSIVCRAIELRSYENILKNICGLNRTSIKPKVNDGSREDKVSILTRAQNDQIKHRPASDEIRSR